MDGADEDRACQEIIQEIQGEGRFLWFWLPPDTKPREDPAHWDHAPGEPMVKAPEAGEVIQLRDRAADEDAKRPPPRVYRVVRSMRGRLKNFGWVLLEESLFLAHAMSGK